MRFNWLHYLDLAQELCEQAENSGHRDANLRSSISRAYYATYHKSQQLLKDKWGIVTSKDSHSHQQVQDEFNKQDQKEIAEYLHVMRRNRNNADYRDKYRNIEEAAQANILLARQVLSDLSRL